MRIWSAFRASRWAVFQYAFLFSLLLVAIFYSDSRMDLRLRLQRSVFDQFNKLAPREASGRVIIVDLDEESLRVVGQWPWPRNIMADLVTNLTEMGGKAIAFDGVLAEEDRYSPKYFVEHLPPELEILEDKSFQDTARHLDYDVRLADAIKKSSIFVTAFTQAVPGHEQRAPFSRNVLSARPEIIDVFTKYAVPFEAAAVNLPIFSKNAAGNGSFIAKPDTDGVLRRSGMIFTNGKKLYPSLSLEALRVAAGGRQERVLLLSKFDVNKKLSEADAGGKLIDMDYRVKIGGNIVPINRDGFINLYYRYFCSEQEITDASRKCTNLDYISAYKVLDREHYKDIENLVRGRIVLMGASAEGLKDLRNTALEAFRPGVEIHANMIEQVLQGKYLLRTAVTEDAEASFILFAGAFFILVSPFIGVLVSVCLCLAIIAAAFFGAYWAYVEHGLLIDPVYPGLAVLTIFIVSTVLSYARAESRRKTIRNAFGMYVAPDVMRELEKDPDKLKLGGETRDLTVMFTDIRKFTSISEGLSPEELIQLINEFLTVMTDIVMRNRGTLDKYIGDAMMAFWNAPRDLENHERLACRAALAMQEALAPVNARLQEEARAQGREPVPLQAGIGINTGVCAVGNMGSKQRFAYSALGDAVNLAARLEGQTKMYGVSILIGERTYEHVRDMAALELDLIRVVGKRRPVRIYALLGDEEMAGTEAFQVWAAAHLRMTSAYFARAFDAALEEIKTCRSLSDGTLDAYYAMYEKRIRSLMTEKLPDDWDGVFVAETK